jgi:2-polyprenyl-3-methyl-5-hydroxy-6-metoxy-1,4-benzoquinol methylase
LIIYAFTILYFNTTGMRRTSHGQTKEPILEYILREIRFTKAAKHIKDNSTVADLGCGYEGKFLQSISKRIRDGVGFDISIKHPRLPNNIVFKKANLNIKFDNNRKLFDNVTALAVIEHIENPEKFIKNIRAILKKNGKLIITTPHKRGKWLLELLSNFLGLISKYEIHDHKRYYDEKSIKKLFKVSNLKLEKVETFLFGLNLFATARKL